MAQGIGLAGGYGAGGAGDALTKILAQKFEEAQFAERQRATQVAETQAAAELAQRTREASAVDKRSKATLDAAAREFASRLGLDREKFGEDRRQFGVVDVREREKAQASQANTDRAFGLDEAQLQESGRHNRASEGIMRTRADASASGVGPTKIVQGRNEEGQAVSYLVDREGNILKSFDRPVSSADQRAATEADVSAQAVKNIRDLYKSTYVGPLQGRLTRAKTATGVASNPDLAKFAAAVAHMKNEIIRDITGAAVGVQEEGRIMGEIPDLTDPPDTFMAKLELTEKNRKFLQERAAARTGQGPATNKSGAAAGSGTKDSIGIR